MTEEVSTRITDLENRIGRVEVDVRACVRELIEPDGRYLVMERLPRLGSAVVGPIHELLDESGAEDMELRAMAALVALEVGDESVASILLHETESGGQLAPLVARRLADRRIHGTSDAVLTALRASPTDADVVVAYLDALHRASAVLPEADRETLLGSASWQVRDAIEEWFPAS